LNTTNSGERELAERIP